MRKLSWMLVAVCLLSLPMFGQSRRRGYSPAGGWHRKAGTAAPAPRTDGRKHTDKRSTQTPPRTTPPSTR